MGSSLFGGGTSRINSTTDSNSNTNYNTNQAQNTAQNQAQNQAQTTAGTSNPSAWQMPYLSQGLNAASGIFGYYNGAGAGNAPQLNYSSLITPQFSANAGQLDQAAQGNANTYGGMINTGSGLLPSFGQAQTGAGGILSRTMADPTQGNIASAGQYANNPYTQGMIRAAQTPIERQLNEVSIPNLNIGAAGTGNTDSSRAAMSEAILRRSAGEDEANVASNILGSQYSNGLNLAEGARTANLNAGLNASGLLNTIGNSGVNAVNSGNAGQLQDLNVPITVDQMYQQDANNQNATDYQNSQGQYQFPWQNLSNYWNIAGRPLGTSTTGSSLGTGNATSTGTSTGNTSGTSNTVGTNLTNGTQTQPGPGILGGVLGAASGIGSFFAPGAFGAPSLFNSIFR